MAIAERGAAESAQRIADALEAAGIPYAIGGALALAIAGVPRGTIDVSFVCPAATARAAHRKHGGAPGRGAAQK